MSLENRKRAQNWRDGIDISGTYSIYLDDFIKMSTKNAVKCDGHLDRIHVAMH